MGKGHPAKALRSRTVFSKFLNPLGVPYEKILNCTSCITTLSIAYGACPSPLPTCGMQGSYSRISSWPGCDMTRSCPADGSKYARFCDYQDYYTYLGIDMQWHACVQGLITSGPILNN